MAGAQTLFSFELFVEKVRFDAAGRVKADEAQPAVGVRLLDFPTLLIYRSENLQSEPKLEPGGLSESSGDSFCFNKGKSCLFKISLDSLHSQLCSAPLCVMVLDVNSEIPKLLGSSLISLSDLTGSVKSAVEKHGIWTPAAHGEKFSSRILNLMGETIGTISLSCKIVSLGASAIPHVSESEACGAPPKPNNTECAPAEGNVNSGTDEIQPPGADSRAGDVSQATVKPSGTKTLHAATQTEHLRQKDATSLDAQVKSDELCGAFCPPPLFYSASRAKRQQSAGYRMKDLEEHLRKVDLHGEDTDDGSESFQMEPAPQKPMRPKEVRSPTSLGQQQSQTVPSVLTDAVRQLPLLNALLAELSHLSSQMQQPLSGHPVNFMSAQESSPSSRKPQTESLKPSGPGCRRGNLPGRVPPLISLADGKSHHERSRPERKLRYGLTHSFRLRLKQIKPGTTRHRECTEELKMRKRSPKPKPEHSQTFNTYLDASGETLPNRSRSQRSPAPGKQTKSPAVKDVPDKADKEVQVRVPSALGQNIDHKAYDSVSNSQPHVIQTSPDFRSSIQSDGKPSSPSHSSLSRHDSPQPDDYQDDFTSLDPTDASPDPLSSPEPYRPPRTRVSSCNVSSDSSSQRNKPHPVPVKAETSPKRSLRATHSIRPHLQNFARSTSSDDSFSRTSGQRNSESHGSSLKSPTASRIFETPVGERSQRSEDSMLESVSSTDSEEQRDELGSLSFQNKYRPISELVVNKLPGYTL
ncbi:microtubule-associated protein 10 [Colossoma macropomum]|uniref:microtubule-associated protein 10 n=1 Tax=Colossoma macropomum TaxID=42526 RepID=UPI001863F93E|nr:microtubule-associated protein 10 [Colossoma macropomum]